MQSSFTVRRRRQAEYAAIRAPLMDGFSGAARCLQTRAGTFSCVRVWTLSAKRYNIPLGSLPTTFPFTMQLYLEFRPESFDGIVLLTGERDDLTGDFMALLIHQGFIEFW